MDLKRRYDQLDERTAQVLDRVRSSALLRAVLLDHAAAADPVRLAPLLRGLAPCVRAPVFSEAALAGLSAAAAPPATALEPLQAAVAGCATWMDARRVLLERYAANSAAAARELRAAGVPQTDLPAGSIAGSSAAAIAKHALATNAPAAEDAADAAPPPAEMWPLRCAPRGDPAPLLRCLHCARPVLAHAFAAHLVACDARVAAAAAAEGGSAAAPGPSATAFSSSAAEDAAAAEAAAVAAANAAVAAATAVAAAAADRLRRAVLAEHVKSVAVALAARPAYPCAAHNSSTRNRLGVLCNLFMPARPRHVVAEDRYRGIAAADPPRGVPLPALPRAGAPSSSAPTASLPSSAAAAAASAAAAAASPGDVTATGRPVKKRKLSARAAAEAAAAGMAQSAKPK